MYVDAARFKGQCSNTQQINSSETGVCTVCHRKKMVACGVRRKHMSALSNANASDSLNTQALQSRHGIELADMMTKNVGEGVLKVCKGLVGMSSGYILPMVVDGC